MLALKLQSLPVSSDNSKLSVSQGKGSSIPKLILLDNIEDLVLGRVKSNGEQCAILSDIRISQRHARIFLARNSTSRPSFLIEDLDSTNGTAVNSKLLHSKIPVALNLGDSIVFSPGKDFKKNVNSPFPISINSGFSYKFVELGKSSTDQIEKRKKSEDSITNGSLNDTDKRKKKIAKGNSLKNLKNLKKPTRSDDLDFYDRKTPFQSNSNFNSNTQRLSSQTRFHEKSNVLKLKSIDKGNNSQLALRRPLNQPQICEDLFISNSQLFVVEISDDDKEDGIVMEINDSTPKTLIHLEHSDNEIVNSETNLNSSFIGLSPTKSSILLEQDQSSQNTKNQLIIPQIQKRYEKPLPVIPSHQPSNLNSHNLINFPSSEPDPLPQEPVTPSKLNFKNKHFEMIRKDVKFTHSSDEDEIDDTKQNKSFEESSNIDLLISPASIIRRESNARKELVNSMAEVLECAICLGLLLKPLSIFPCNHNFCSDSCPTCRTLVEGIPVPSHIAEKMVDKTLQGNPSMLSETDIEDREARLIKILSMEIRKPSVTNFRSIQPATVSTSMRIRPGVRNRPTDQQRLPPLNHYVDIYSNNGSSRRVEFEARAEANNRISYLNTSSEPHDQSHLNQGRESTKSNRSSNRNRSNNYTNSTSTPNRISNYSISESTLHRFASPYEVNANQQLCGDTESQPNLHQKQNEGDEHLIAMAIRNSLGY
ncbi:hypothetical protein HK096_001729 [Nowakowskiella sp. JEL0078]|nr:hypothetical protein HK096_001729 [Nowakowskiella sp. JEL0078]